MKNKKAAKKIFDTLTKIILLLVLLIVVLLAIFGLDFHSFFESLPDFLPGGGNPTDLREDVEIMVLPVPGTIPVTILLNDGDGRCIIVEAPLAGYDYYSSYDWLKDYGVKNWGLEINGHEENTRIDWLTNQMIEDQSITSGLILAEKSIIQDVKDEYSSDISLIYYDPYAPVEPSGRPEDEPLSKKIYEQIINNNNLDLSTLDSLSEDIKNGFINKLRIVDLEQYKANFVTETLNENTAYFFQSSDKTNFYVRGGEIYTKNQGQLEEYSALDPEDVKNQIIRQDLIEKCHLDEGEFKTATILSQEVTLLKRDGAGKCVVYASLNNRELERYAVKKPIFRLAAKPQYYYLSEIGKWEPKTLIRDEEKIREAEIIIKLKEKEKQIVKLISEAKVCTLADGTYLGKGHTQNEIDQLCNSPYELKKKIDETKQNNNLDALNYLQKHSDFVILTDLLVGEFHPSSTEINDYINKMNAEDKDNSIQLIPDGSKIYLRSKEGDYKVRGGKIESFSGKTLALNPLASKSMDDLLLIKNQNQIFEQLEKAC